MKETMLQVGVKVFLRNPDGKYLLLRRSREKYPDIDGEWDIVGGRIVPGSPLMDNLRREVKEETGLEMTSEPLLIAAQDIIRSADRHVVRLSYVGTAEGEPILDERENVEYRWISLEELKTLDNLDVYVKAILDKGPLRE